jgi:hypothetical protein
MKKVRSFLAVLVLSLTGCASASTPRSMETPTTSAPPLSSLTPNVQVIGQPETVFDRATQRCSDAEHPDLPVRVFRDAQDNVQMIISSPTNYRLIGSSLDALQPDCTPILHSAHDRDPSHYNTSNWLGATYTLDGSTIYAIVHDEYHGDQDGSIWQADQDFQTVQGGHHWRYQSWNGATYTNMTYDATHNRWQGSRPLCQLADRWAHPDIGCEPTRTWISPITGTITISGSVYDLDSGGGNGVTASILNGARQLWAATINNGDSSRRSFNLKISVHTGDAIHFRVNARDDNTYDTTYFNPGINIGPAPCPSGKHDLCQLLSLTFAVSTDGGKTYVQPPSPDNILAIPPYQYNPDAMRAIWQPSNIVHNPNDGYYYALLQRDEHGPATGTNIQGTCVMRTQSLNDPTSWRAWDGEGFTMRFINPYQDATADPAAHTCQVVSPSQIGALTYSLTYNTYFGAFLAVGVRGDGFYYALSDDLVHWTPARLLLSAVQGFANGFKTPYYAYPSVVDPNSPSRNFDTSGQSVYLYYSRFNSVSPLNIDLLRVRIAFSR